MSRLAERMTEPQADVEVLIDPTYRWRSEARGRCRVHMVGDPEAMGALAGRLLDLGEAPGASAVDQVLMSQDAHGAAIIETPAAVIAFTDHCRAYPVFLAEGAPAAVANSARRLKARAGLESLDEVALSEFAMAGYVTGGATLYRGLGQLRAGERAVWDKRQGGWARGRYFRYAAEVDDARREDDWIEALSAVIDRVIGRAVARAAGRPIWVPLSAGLDSRLILAKLQAMGCERLESFSYGPAGNWEARAARRVAARLGVPWRFVEWTRRDARDYFHSETRKAYWDFADGLSALPNPQDMEPLLALRRRDALPEDAVIVNGQSGDFITGGHLRPAFLEPGFDAAALVEAIIDKHYGLWRPLQTPERLESVRAKLRDELGLGDDDGFSPEALAARYENWEYDERQAKFVVHGQRIYDFLGLDWQLPLWDFELVRFFQSVPLPLKLGQLLYRKTLERWDHRGLFRGPEPVVWKWPGASIAVVPLARAAGLVAGRARKDRVYALAAYLGHSRPLYAPYGWRRFLRHHREIRNSLALNVQTWLGENGIPRTLLDVGQAAAEA